MTTAITGLEGLEQKLQGETVFCHSDNIIVAKIITRGSRKPDIQDIVMGIFSLCIKHSIRIIPKWIPREENKEADAISKMKRLTTFRHVLGLSPSTDLLTNITRKQRGSS